MKNQKSRRNLRFYVLSDTSLQYRELRFFKTKVVLSGLLSGLLALGVFFLANHYSKDVLGLGYGRMSVLTIENRILKDQLSHLSDRMGVLQQTIDEISKHGNELRLLVDLSTIDEDTKNAGAGGSDDGSPLLFVSGEANDILVRSQDLVDKLNREVELQRASYEEVYRKYEQNKIFFSHLPAIKPVAGNYSIVGFGMRVHPVLGIHRMHEGIDIVTDVGTKVFATGDGIVRYAGRTHGGYGSVIEISHGYGYTTLYAHLSTVYVRPGQLITRGELIARSGRSGLVSGPHLHYEVKYKGRKVNPVDFFFDDIEAATFRSELLSDHSL